MVLLLLYFLFVKFICCCCCSVNVGFCLVGLVWCLVLVYLVGLLVFGCRVISSVVGYVSSCCVLVW